MRPALQRGFTMVELLAALAIAALMITGVTAIINTSLEDARGQQAALYQSQLTQAAAQLIQQNTSALLAAVSSAPVAVPLTGAGYQLATYLPSGVQAHNAYGQTPCLLVSANGSGGLQGLLVTEGGTAIGDKQLGYIAANSGAGGGSIPATNNAAGAAIGAFGAWRFAAPNPANKSCSGVKTGVGHLVSEVFPANGQPQNGDYLYRVSVPGNAAANAMQVPIVLAQQTDYAACSAPAGSIAADSNSNVVTCENNVWTPITSAHWRDPVASAADLGSLPNPQLGDVAMTTNTGRPYTFNGTAWQAVAVDEQGSLYLGNQQVAGTSCDPSKQPNTTPVTTDANGRVLSCQPDPSQTSGYSWQTQTEIVQASKDMNCEVVMGPPGPDYGTCLPQTSADYFAYPYQYNGTNGTYSHYRYVPVTMAKTGIIAVSSWAHMNDGVASGQRGARAQISQDIDVLDSNGNSLGHTESQGPTLVDDSGGISNALTQSVAAGKYNVRIVTNWATYAVIGTPWSSSLKGQDGSTITNTPIADGWTVNSYY